MTLPTTLDDLTPDWLTTALSSRAPGTVVGCVNIESVIWGTATKVFLKVTYANRGAEGPGEALCVKGGFQEELRDVAGVGFRSADTEHRRQHSMRAWLRCAGTICTG